MAAMAARSVSHPVASSKALQLMRRHPDCVLVVVHRADDVAPPLTKTKFVVPRDMSLSQFNCVLRAYTSVDKHQTLFLFVGDGVLPAPLTSLAALYDAHRHESDLALHLTYGVENAFG